MSDRRSESDRGAGGGRGAGASVSLALAAVVALALALRVGPMFWSPHPSTLDGFGYAWQARETAASGAYPLSQFRVDNFGYATVLALLALVTDAAPLTLIQPVTSVIGTAGVLFGIALAGRLAGEFGWTGRRRAAAMVATGAVLAVDGLYLRRTSVADEEVLALVMLPALVLAVHLALSTGRRRHVGLSALLVAAFPVTHVLSTLLAWLSLVGLVVAHAARSPSRRTLVGGAAAVSGFGAYFAAYFLLARRAGTMVVPYVDRVESYPGLFVAWVVVFAVGAAWFLATGRRLRRLAVGLPFAAVILVALANAAVPVFPGTSTTPAALLVPILALGVPAAAAALASSSLSSRRPTSAALVGMLGAPLALIGFCLTAALTAEYFATAMRTQTFLHLPAAVLIGAALARYGVAPRAAERVDGGRSAAGGSFAARRGSTRVPASRVGTALRRAFVAVVVVSLLLSTPLAYLNVDTATYPSTTLDSEFRGVEFASANVAEPWTTDHSLSRVGVHYFREETGYAAAGSWLRGGPAPSCPVVAQRSWHTTGAHLFPSAPGTVSDSEFRTWLATGDLVYANTGRDPVFVSLPANSDGAGC